MRLATKLKKLKAGDDVRVWWDDAGSHDSSWRDSSEIVAEDFRCKSVGTFVRFDGRYMILAGMYGADQECNVLHQVPTGCITEIEVFTLKRGAD